MNAGKNEPKTNEKDAINELKTNEKNAKKTPFEKRELRDYALNEKKDKIIADLRINFYDFPEILELIEDRIFWESHCKNLVIELVETEEQAERYSLEISETLGRLEKAAGAYRRAAAENEGLRRELERAAGTREAYDNLYAQNSKLREACAKLREEAAELKKGRGVMKTLEDKREILRQREAIGRLRGGIKDLKGRLARVGREPIPRKSVEKIIALRKDGLGYDRIARMTGVSKSTVCKYVGRYLG